MQAVPAPRTPRRFTRTGLPAWTAALLCLGCTAGFAAIDEAPAGEGLGERREPLLQLEVSRSDLPRLEFSAQDAAKAGVGPNAGSTIGTGSQTRLDLTGWAWPHRQAGPGLSLGMEWPSAQDNRPQPEQRFATGPAAMDLGLRWRWALDGGGRIDMSASRRMAPPQQDALSMIENSQQGLYRASIEMRFATARSRGITPEFGAIGMQLDSGARLSLRTKRGKPMLYYRSRF